MVGFSKDIEKELMSATSPFTFWRVNESSVMRFLKLIGCDNGKVGSYAALVKERNDTTHTNGNIFFSTQAALDTKIAEILRVVVEIQAHSKPIIERCYHDFLLASCDPDERVYPDPEDQIRELLIHGNYLSQRDLDICREHALTDLLASPGSSEIQNLHGALIAAYLATE